jgi:hypothetical protein
MFRDCKRVHRVDDRLAFPARQGLRNLAMFPERDRQDDCVGLECIPQRLGDDRGSNRPSLRRQRLAYRAKLNVIELIGGRKEYPLHDNLQQCTQSSTHFPFSSSPLLAG